MAQLHKSNESPEAGKYTSSTEEGALRFMGSRSPVSGKEAESSLETTSKAIKTTPGADPSSNRHKSVEEKGAHLGAMLRERDPQVVDLQRQFEDLIHLIEFI